jgi:hypothetical protein
VTKPRKRISPLGEFDEFYDLAHKYGWHVDVARWLDDDDGQVLLQVQIRRGVEMHLAPSVLDVNELGASTAHLRKEMERA